MEHKPTVEQILDQNRELFEKCGTPEDAIESQQRSMIEEYRNNPERFRRDFSNYDEYFKLAPRD